MIRLLQLLFDERNPELVCANSGFLIMNLCKGIEHTNNQGNG